MKLDVEKLPGLDVFRADRWMPVQCALEPSDVALHWPGPIPVFAIAELAVGTAEERTRLAGLARSVSNVEFPDVPITVGAETVDIVPTTAPCEGTPKFVIPPVEDSIRGAMSMALWAVPRIDPWLDVLVAGLSSDLAPLGKLVAKVDAGWLRFPPWTRRSDDAPPVDDLQDCFWLAAVDVFRNRSANGPAHPQDLAEEVAAAASRRGCSSGAAANWLDATRRILRAESAVRLDHWRSHPVGTAIQLVLTRLEPTRFKTWCKDLPGLPPAVWWSAAMLCGLHHGYRRLDTRFRGQGEQRERIAVQALRASSVEAHQIDWPFLAAGEPHWRRDADGFELLWSDKAIVRKPYQARGRWYAADFDDEGVRGEARAVAKELDWSCLDRELRLTQGRYRVSGPDTLKTRDGELDVRGSVDLRLPPDAVIEDALNVESFRHLVAVEAGRLKEPPAFEEPIKRPDGIPGLTYKPDFLSESKATEIVGIIDQRAWSEELQRRVQHYGWQYDYKTRQVDAAMRIGPLPGWADDIAQRLVREGLVPDLPNQVIVNEYVGDQGISRHVDSESSFADGIAMISLLDSWEMVFRRGREKRIRRLEKRSVAVMEGESRYRWTHEIPKRKTEPGKPHRIKRGRRVSLTFRRVIE